MRRSVIAVFLSACLGFSVAACGGGEDEGDYIEVPGEGDGETEPAPAPAPEPEPEPEPAVGIGQICDQNTACPDAAPLCLAFSQGATAGVCTASCGTTPIPEMGQAQPPDPMLDQVCPTYTGSGTSACVLGLQGEPGATDQEWACAILCGTIMTQQGSSDLGECPGGLTCGKDQANLCTP